MSIKNYFIFFYLNFSKTIVYKNAIAWNSTISRHTQIIIIKLTILCNKFNV